MEGDERVNADTRGEISSGESAGRIVALIDVATASESIRDLVAAGGRELGRPLAVFDRDGTPVARYPPGSEGRTAVEAGLPIARGGQTPGRPHESWIVTPLHAGAARTGSIAVRDEPELTPADRELLEAFGSLLAGRLHLDSLAEAVRAERARAIGYRLITDPDFAAAGADAVRAAGIELVERYWPGLVVWERGELPAAALRGIEDLARRHARGSLVVAEEQLALVVLLADEPPANWQTVQSVLEDIVRYLRRWLGQRRVYGLTGETSLPLAEIPARVRSLERLRRLPPRDDEPLAVIGARRFALNRLFFDGLDRGRAVEFVRSQIGAVIAHDAAHRTDLVDTLQAALDYPNRDEAAHAAHMHRNTFRRHLNQAVGLVGADLRDPDERLALHVALRLRRLFDVGDQAPGVVPRRKVSEGGRGER